MKTTLFYAWISRLSIYIGREEGQKILLVIDNYFAWDKGDPASTTECHRGVSSTPNTTRKLQLRYWRNCMGKGKIQKEVIITVFDNLDMLRKSIYTVDIVTAMKWAAEA